MIHRLIGFLPLLVGLGGGMLLTSCEQEELSNNSKDTYYDDIADIAFLNGSFYTTNYDLSGNSGSQIDLLRFDSLSSGYSMRDNYDLDMNGQGYLAMCSDGSDIYLQSRSTELIIKCSPIGEKAFYRYDAIESNWHPCGIAYHDDNDSLLLLYRNSHQLNQYRLRAMDKNLEGPSSRDQSFLIPFISQDGFGIYALSFYDSTFYMLGVDSNHVDILVTADHTLSQIQSVVIPDSTVVGLAFQGNDLYLSYRDRRIDFWAGF